MSLGPVSEFFDCRKDYLFCGFSESASLQRSLFSQFTKDFPIVPKEGKRDPPKICFGLWWASRYSTGHGRDKGAKCSIVLATWLKNMMSGTKRPHCKSRQNSNKGIPSTKFQNQLQSFRLIVAIFWLWRQRTILCNLFFLQRPCLYLCPPSAGGTTRFLTCHSTCLCLCHLCLSP